MDGMSNGGMLYHEVQESKLCAVHCVNTVLQGPFFTEFDLAALASDLDRTERQLQGDAAADADPSLSAHFLNEDSHNVSLEGDFSIQVLQKALEVWDLQVIPLESPVAGPAQIDPEMENAFICHSHDHWFSIRKVNGEWYNFDSLYAAPRYLSKFHLAAYLDSLRGYGWTILIVRGNFPRECPISSSESSNGFGQWLLPEDAHRINQACNQTTAVPNMTNLGQQQAPQSPLLDWSTDSVADLEDEDLKAAIAASLMEPPHLPKAEPAVPQPKAAEPSTISAVESCIPQLTSQDFMDTTESSVLQIDSQDPHAAPAEASDAQPKWQDEKAEDP